MTAGRGIDRGNATLQTIKSDLGRIGLTPLSRGAYNRRWSTPGDAADFDRLIKLRNVLAHGNAAELRTLRASGIEDTVTWARRRLPVLNRAARALDHLVWDHLVVTTGGNPWR